MLSNGRIIEIIYVETFTEVLLCSKYCSKLYTDSLYRQENSHKGIVIYQVLPAGKHQAWNPRTGNLMSRPVVLTALLCLLKCTYRHINIKSKSVV